MYRKMTKESFVVREEVWDWGRNEKLSGLNGVRGKRWLHCDMRTWIKTI